MLILSTSYKHNAVFDKLLLAYKTLYSNLASRMACRVVVDASKHPVNAYLLGQVPSIELYILHLVRDARGVLDSWSRAKGYLKRRPSWKIIAQWVAYNWLAEYLHWKGIPYLRIAYEDFVREPAQALDKIVKFVGERETNIREFLKGNQAQLTSEQHPLAGNPGKLSQRGSVFIQEPRWHLPLWKNLWAIATTWPLLVRYGYLTFGRSHNQETGETR